MKTPILHLLSILLLAVPGTLLAQGGPPGPLGSPWFDPDDVVTMTGTVTAVSADLPIWGHGNHVGGGAHAAFVADDGEPYELMLAPAEVLAQLGVTLAAGDRVVVTGSVVGRYGPAGGFGGWHHGPGPGVSDAPFLVVVEIAAGGVTARLRDDDGYPLWRVSMAPFFEPDDIVTLDGVLEESLGLWSPWGFGNATGGGLHYRFTSSGETYYAMLGPWWYLAQHGLELSDGTAARIRGSRVAPYWSRYGDHLFLVATELTVRGVTVRLRDDDGYPLWHGTGTYYACPAYDRRAVTNVTGTVRRTQARRGGRYLDPGFEVLLDVDGERLRVHLAPAWHVDAMGLDLAPGQEVRVRGARAGDGVVARWIEVGGRRWRFRDGRGRPLWARGAR